ncbi:MULTISPECIES: dipeptidase [unclassified Iodidimonas]|jgi:membrane dipeptidase|uniref:dipeptidase n=1 Tax=unclassified Iodidimonas TaxID=2626145 RepID=UPI002482B6DB|nr:MULTISPECIES: dipeptidase [unclassified Iodidimonas]
MKSPFFALCGLFVLAACDQAPKNSDPASGASQSLEARAEKLAHQFLIADTHIDVPYRLHKLYEDVTRPTVDGDFDFPRAFAGGLDVAFMSIYTPAAYEFEAPGKATDHADQMIDLVERIMATAPDQATIARSTDDVMAARAAGRIALPLGMENGAPIAGSLDLLDHFYKRGIRYITLAHSRSNHIADSSYDEARPHDGLTAFGTSLVHAMNRMGIMIDVSHISDQAFWDVMDESATPVLATHSSARHFTPGFERNMADDMIKAMAAKGGVIMINFGSAFLTEAANGYNKRLDTAYEAWLEETEQEASAELETAFETRYRAENPYPFATLSHVLDHIDHVVEIAGIDAVGIGSDYDGVGDSLPVGLKDVSAYPNLIKGLLQRGYDEAGIEKIMGRNLMRLWRAVEDHANEAQNDATAPANE